MSDIYKNLLSHDVVKEVVRGFVPTNEEITILSKMRKLVKEIKWTRVWIGNCKKNRDKAYFWTTRIACHLIEYDELKRQLMTNSVLRFGILMMFMQENDTPYAIKDKDLKYMEQLRSQFSEHILIELDDRFSNKMLSEFAAEVLSADINIGPHLKEILQNQINGNSIARYELEELGVELLFRLKNLGFGNDEDVENLQTEKNED